MNAQKVQGQRRSLVFSQAPSPSPPPQNGVFFTVLLKPFPVNASYTPAGFDRTFTREVRDEACADKLVGKGRVLRDPRRCACVGGLDPEGLQGTGLALAGLHITLIEQLKQFAWSSTSL